MSEFIKAEKVVATALGLLLRELTLPALVWRDAAGDFAGAKDDTISIRLPAYAPARTRSLRSGSTRTKDTIHERKVDVTLDTDVYKDIGISDEELTLDISDFGSQVLNPVLVGIAQKLEDELADEITGATYANELTYDISSGDPYDSLVDARTLLNNAYVPRRGRVVVAGSDFEAQLLKSDKFTDASKSGTTETLREGQIGRIAALDVYASPSIPSNEAYVFHQTAFVMSQRAPIVPSGAPWGATQSHQGLAIRCVRVFDPNEVEDRFVSDAWVGTNVVEDFGHYDADPDTGGKFVPGEDPDNPIDGHTDDWANDTDKLVRAVKITVQA